MVTTSKYPSPANGYHLMKGHHWTKVKSIMDIAPLLTNVGVLPSFSRVMISTDNASRSAWSLLYVSLLPQSTAQALKSPATTHGFP